VTAVGTPVPIIRSEDEGEKRWFYGGGVHTWKARSEETDGAFLLFEDRMEQGKMTPLHTHPDSDETMYVLEGEILIHMDGQEHRVSAGGLAVAPRSVPHAFLVLSDVARLLCLHTPGCCQRSTGTPANPSPLIGQPPARSTSPGSRHRPSRTVGSRSWDHPRSLSVESSPTGRGQHRHAGDRGRQPPQTLAI